MRQQKGELETSHRLIRFSWEFAMRFLSAVPAVALALLVTPAAVNAAKPDTTAFKAGVASRVITPTEPMWMAGYSSRTKPAEEKVHDLYVKALALEDADKGKLVLLTSDLVGIPRDLGEAVAGEVRKKTGLPRERLLLTCSHTHC